jgi:hypothetical protein
MRALAVALMALMAQALMPAPDAAAQTCRGPTCTVAQPMPPPVAMPVPMPSPYLATAPIPLPAPGVAVLAETVRVAAPRVTGRLAYRYRARTCAGPNCPAAVGRILFHRRN